MPDSTKALSERREAIRARNERAKFRLTEFAVMGAHHADAPKFEPPVGFAKIHPSAFDDIDALLNEAQALERENARLREELAKALDPTWGQP